MTEIIYKEESYQIIGACFEVYKEMGCGFLEPVYQECLEMELALQSLPFHPQSELNRTLPKIGTRANCHLTPIRKSIQIISFFRVLRVFRG